MRQVPEIPKQVASEYQTLCFHFPVWVSAEGMHFLSDIHDALRVELGYRVEDIEGVDSDLGAGVRDPNKSVVEEHVKPLLVELFLLSYQLGLTTVDRLVISNVVLECLNYFNS